MAFEHRITWQHRADGSVRGVLTCSGGVGSSCRLVCVVDDGADGDLPDVPDVPDCHRDHAHALVDAGVCGAVVAAHGRDVGVLYAGAAGAPVRDGVVEVHRDGEHWSWRYPPQAGELAAAADEARWWGTDALGLSEVVAVRPEARRSVSA